MDRNILTDAQWAKMEPHCLGKPADPGRSGRDNRLFMEAVLWIVGAVPVAVQLVDERPAGSKRHITFEDMSDGASVILVNNEQPVLDAVAERHRAPHPHALRLGLRDLVADPLAGHFTLELGEREQHVER